MWLPGRVQPEHKVRAYMIWGSLVAALLSYTLWVIVSAIEKRKNPSVGITVERGHYMFPDITVCFYETAGCDQDYIDFCTESPILLDLPRSATTYVGFEVDEQALRAKKSTVFAHNCLEFTLSELPLSEDVDDSLESPQVQIVLQWVAAKYFADQPSTLRKVVYIFLTDGDEDILQDTPGIEVPYTRILGTNAVSSVVTTSLSTHLTETTFLSGKTDRVYSAASTVQYEYELLNSNWTAAYEDSIDGLLVLDILQPSLSHTVLDESDPVQIATIVGSIGGAWELLLIIWGVIFIARERQPPDQKGRDFVKSARLLAQNTGKVVTDGIGGLSGLRKNSTLNTDSTGEEIPYYERTSDPAARRAAGGQREQRAGPSGTASTPAPRAFTSAFGGEPPPPPPRFMFGRSQRANIMPDSRESSVRGDTDLAASARQPVPLAEPQPSQRRVSLGGSSASVLVVDGETEREESREGQRGNGTMRVLGTSASQRGIPKPANRPFTTT